MRMTHVDRNPKWRLGDIVYMKTCAECSVKVEWQAELPEDNTANNFHTYLYNQKGWRQRNVGIFGLGGKEWICELHK